ncbi:Hypothetical protein PBC10988_25770 [Planctomycetales bacterium 10988]|nr:Hypothetical protein PBC10988_25770 [Planctomycetales bacterium 10988]
MKKPKKMIDRPYHLTEGDVLSELKKMPPNVYDGGLCDPPYGLGFMGKKWDENVPGIEVWREMLRVMKPGAYLLAFGSPKTFHRLMCHIEDAGWEVMETICWLYGEGFPKSNGFSKRIRRYRGHSKTARRFQGYGTSLKPAWEPIVLAMKPVHGSYANNAVVFGNGGLNIDECRIGTNGGTNRSHQAPYPRTEDGRENRRQWARSGHSVEPNGKGRWPANLLLDDEAARVLDEQSGWSQSSKGRRRKAGSLPGNGRTMGHFHLRLDGEGGYDDEGGASRFFYVAKASGKERDGNDHPSLKPVELCKYLARLILPPKRDTPRCLLVPFSGSGSEMIGANIAGWDHVRGIEKNKKYIDIARERLRNRDYSNESSKQDRTKRIGPPLRINTITKGDCAKVIPRVPDKSVNLVLCSPPYPEKRGDKYPTVSERNYPAWTARWMDELKTKLNDDGNVLIVIDHVVKDGVISDFLLRTQLFLRESGWNQHMPQKWFKVNGPPLGHTSWPRHCYEEILWFSRTTKPFCDPWAIGTHSENLSVGNYRQSDWTNGDKPKKEGTARTTDVFSVPVGGNTGIDHPAMYPQALCEALIKTFCPEGGTVLDCFAGSGTTLLAAQSAGRNFYGIDVMKKYVDLARRRLDEIDSQVA